MKSSLLASIIIDNYNYGRFIDETINSALNQDCENIEVIVVDDGSTDDSRDVIESFGDKIIPVYKPNGGQASALNAGFNKSKGDVIFFLDSDGKNYQIKNSNSALAKDYINFIISRNNNNLWIGTSNTGLNEYDGLSFIQFENLPKNIGIWSML